MYSSDLASQTPKTAGGYFGEEISKIVLIEQNLKRNSGHATPFISLLSHDLLAADIFAQRSISPEHYQVLPGNNVNADIWQLYADTQGFYIFAGKAMLAMYLLLAEAAPAAVKAELTPHIGSHGAFLKFVLSKQTALSESLRLNISHSLLLLDRCIYRKRNKMIEHWTDNKHQRDLFPCYYLIDVPIVYFINNDTFGTYAERQKISAAADGYIAKIKNITLDVNTGPAEKLAVLDYFYPKLSRNFHDTLDQLINPQHIIVLSVSPYLVTALKKFMTDMFKVIDSFQEN